MMRESADKQPSDPEDDWLERLSEERRQRNPVYVEIEARISSEGPNFVVERMTNEDGRILDEPQVVASSHPEDLGFVATRDADAGREVPSAYEALG